MRDNNMKTEDYLNQNPIVKNFINKVDEEINTYYKTTLSNLTVPELKVHIGNKFIKLILNNSVWGFISRVDGELKGAPIKKGDLLKPASWKSPAKHARGNVSDGTARYGVYGPEYL
jgi:hypothetical protein